ncbi:MAG: hypothetical protein ACYC9Z_14080 [Casimicrobiaceae bacterium]
MLKNLTLRAKILIGLALICAGYVVMMPDASQTIEPAHGGAAPVARPAKPGAKSPVALASFRRSDRIIKDTVASALFSVQSWYVAPPPPPPPPPVAAAPPPAPTAPPLPFAFMGSYRQDGAAAPTYFLTAGDRVYDVKVGDTLDNTYSVDGVKSGQLLLTYMPLKIQQSLAVGDTQ